MAWEELGVGFVLLGGDDESGMPLRYGTPDTHALPPPQGDPEDYIPTDLYFSDLDGNWDVDHDERYGEIPHDSANSYPEVFVGRILSRDSVEALNWRLKHDTYCRNPQNKEILNHFLGFAGDTSFSPGLSQLYRDKIAPHGNTGHLYTEINANDAVDYLGIGYGLCAIYADGCGPQFSSVAFSSSNVPLKNVWGHRNGESADNSGLNYIETHDMHYIVFTISTCSGAEYDTMGGEVFYTLADGFMDVYPDTSGAVAFMGLTRGSGGYSYDDELATSFFGNLMANPSQPIGIIYAEAKCDLDFSNQGGRCTCYSHNLFGNPLMRAWTEVPEYMNDTFPTLIPTGPQYFTVTVSDSQDQGVGDALVCFYKESDVYNLGYTDNNGRITFYISPRSPGELVVTCTKYEPQAYLPCQNIATVAGGPSPFGIEHQKESPILPLSITSYASISKTTFKFRYSVPFPKPMGINLYNSMGAKVISYSWSPPAQGYYDFLSPTSVPSGVYWVELIQENNRVIKKLVILK